MVTKINAMLIVSTMVSTKNRRNQGLTYNARQTKASTKSITANLFYRIGDGNARQTIAFLKSRISNTYYRIGDGNARQTLAIRKSSFSNTCYRIGNGNALQAIATVVFTTDYYSIFYR